MKLKYFFLIILIILVLTACSEEKAALTIVIDGTQNFIDTKTIYNGLDSVAFPVVVRSSGEKPVEAEYKGVELSKLLSTCNIETSNFEKITFNASDGYRIILSTGEIQEPSNVYLTFERDGQILKS